MNIIRSTAVELSAIPAIAYKQKLKSGGAGIRILRLDTGASAVATIDKRTGEAVHYGAVDEGLFPYEAFEEALDLTLGLPFSARGKIAIKAPDAAPDQTEIDADAHEDADEIDILETGEYKALIERYSDEKGELNYQLLNKDCIQFASKSKVVSSMLGEKAQTSDIVLFVVKNRAAYVAGAKEQLPDGPAAKLVEALDEINPRSAFKELKAHINRQLAKVKR
jgi:hypothetical protein